MNLSATTQARIEEALRTWHLPDGEARQRFEQAKRRLDAQYQHITDAIVASERLTAEDMMFRVD